MKLSGTLLLLVHIFCTDTSVSMDTALRELYMGEPMMLNDTQVSPSLSDSAVTYIDQMNSSNITASLGMTALLHCRVKNLGNRTVSWIRLREYHLLTVGRYTYSSDQRFQAVHQIGSDDWGLKIRYVQERDAGRYDCQVSTTPPITHTVHLSVIATEASIIDGPEVYIKAGTELSLNCIIKYSQDPPDYVFWYHNDRMVNYDIESGIRVGTTRTDHLVTTFTLQVEYANQSHSGNYTCAPSNSKPDSINVYIFEEPGIAIPKFRVYFPSSSTAAIIFDEPIASNGQISGYTVFYTTNPSLPTPSWKFKSVQATNQTAIDDLTPDTTYTIRVQAYTDRGSGPLSDPVEVQTEPELPPQIVHVRSLSPSSVVIQWDNPISSDIEHYRVYYTTNSSLPIASWRRNKSVQDTNRITISNLTPETTYTIRVQAYTDRGPGPLSDPVEVKTPKEAARGTSVPDSCEGMTELREEMSMLKNLIYELKDLINTQNELLIHTHNHLHDAPAHTHNKTHTLESP